MHIDSRFQSKKKQLDDWGWYEEDMKPRHRLMNENTRFSDGGLGPRSARPAFDPQPSVYSSSIA